MGINFPFLNDAIAIIVGEICYSNDAIAVIVGTNFPYLNDAVAIVVGVYISLTQMMP